MAPRLAPAPVLVTDQDAWKIAMIGIVGNLLAAKLVLHFEEHVAMAPADPDFYYPKIGVFLCLYLFGLVVSRFYGHGAYTLYDSLWGCNVSLLLVGLACLLSKPFLIGVAMVTVSGDQICWYIDAIGFLLYREFPVGVMKYTTYPENRTISKHLFTYHHLWFLPLCLWLTQGHGGIQEWSFLTSCALTSFLACYSRLLTPFEIKAPQERHIIYANTNGAYEFWRDVPIAPLHVLDHASPWVYLPFISVAGNLVANGIPHLVLVGLSLTFNHHFGKHDKQ